jgi:Uma2 family endonuclease
MTQSLYESNIPLWLAKQHTFNHYSDREILADTKDGYINGEIIATTGGTPNHNRISGNLFAILHTHLRNQPFVTFITDQPPQLMEGRKDTIVNPIFISEVLSDSTADYDRTEKLAYYRTIESFQEYLLISEYRKYLEHFYRDADRWIFNAYVGETMINLVSLQIQVSTSEIYERIAFQES